MQIVSLSVPKRRFPFALSLLSSFSILFRQHQNPTLHLASKEREATNLQSECAGIRATFPARTSAARTSG